jgi:hypothetical protein
VSREDIAAIASRLFAIFIAVTALRTIGTTFQVAYQSEVPKDASVYIFLAIILGTALSASLVLWFFPLSIARKLLPVMKEPQPAVTWQSGNAMELALAVFGFWILADAIADAFYWGSFYYYVQQATGTGLETVGAAEKADMFVTVIELVLGSWLVLGHRGVAALFYRIRFGSQA